MKKFILFTAFFILTIAPVIAQVSISNDNSAPDNSAMLDVKSTFKGILLPRMTQEQILAIQNPSNGLIAFCTTDSKLYVYVSTSSQWKEVPYGAGILGQSFPCNFTITISHIAGAVAPVNKTVAYGTVNGIPGELAKCWITSNLGSDHQAPAVSDATEQSAGWYWQFNRKQGFKHDGTTRTPGTAWITSIVETSDWMTANDPCTIELGTGWRIPTNTEWTNVDAGGSWTNWNGPFGSALKLHAAGYLNYSDGSLNNRGAYGTHWCSTQNGVTNGWYLNFSSGGSGTANSNMAYGFSIRCIRDN